MRLIFCDSVIDTKQVEPDYEEEFISAKKQKLAVSLISFEELNNGNIEKALRSIPNLDKEEMAIYRGWMLTPKTYSKFYNSLLNKKVRLINSPAEYQHCHYFPDSYSIIKNHTPKSNWTTVLSEDSINKLTDDFGDHPIIVKDYVKSEKHNWEDACYISNASNKIEVNRVVDNFLKLRGEYLNSGIVFRQFEKIQFLTNHSKSSMPLTKEYRLFFINHTLVSVFNYWDEGEYGTDKPNLEKFTSLANQINSNFFTMDIAQKENGSWIIMELGDGQVAGLPDNANKEVFYSQLLQLI